jgi:hypothetical protein
MYTSTDPTICQLNPLCTFIPYLKIFTRKKSIKTKSGNEEEKKRWIMCTHFVNMYCNTYLLTPWSRVFLEELTGSQVVKKFPAFYGTLRFITAFTRARHLSLSSARSIHSIPPHATS